jgi:2-polyprenyl-3-methyl-5-hydroxy-6-metoxy-1,4-benzoquinol methylase
MKCILCNYDTSKIIADELRSGEKRNIYYCEECELGILDDNQSEEELKKFYDEEYRKKAGPKLNQATNPQELFDVDSRFQENRINLIKDKLNKNMKLLEVGCSAGMFLFHVRNYVKEVIGIDYDSESAKFASEKCECKTYTTDIEETDLEKNNFDAICFFQVLEHVKDPNNFIKKLKEYLKPDGIIFIEVPNLYDSLAYAYDLPNHKKFYYHSAHLWYFTKKSLKLLLEKAGFEGNVFFIQDYNLLNHMYWISIDKPQGDSIKGLSLPKLPLRETLEKDKKEELDFFIKSMDQEYKKLLAKLELSSNIAFIGKKK